MKSYATVHCLDVKIKPREVLKKNVITPEMRWNIGCCLDFILFSTRSRDGILPSRDEFKFYVDVLSSYKHQNYQAITWTYSLTQKCCTSFQDGGNIRLIWLLFDIILFPTRKLDGILISRDTVPCDSALSWCKDKTTGGIKEKRH